MRGHIALLIACGLGLAAILLSVTCNSTLATLAGGLAITARTAATSFQVTYNGTIATNPLCVSYLIVN